MTKRQTVYQLSDDRVHAIYERATGCGLLFLYTISKEQCGDSKRAAHDFSHYGSLDFLTDTWERCIETTKKHWRHLKDMNVCKANYICHGINTYPKQKRDIVQQNIFEAQLQNYVNTADCTVAILNAFPIF